MAVHASLAGPTSDDDDQDGAAGEAGGLFLGDVGVAGVDEEAGVAVPHHGLEVALEPLAAGVVAAGLVLAVVLGVAEDRRLCRAAGGLDEGQLRVDLVRPLRSGWSP